MVIINFSDEEELKDEIEDWEKEQKKQKNRNKKILKEFKIWLEEKKLKEVSVNKHINNIDFYINEFLLYENNYPAETGVNPEAVEDFLGSFFIRKCMWASKTTMKENGTSIKKFYAFMFEKNKIDKQELKDLEEEIKNKMETFLKRIERYDDPDNFDEDWF